MHATLILILFTEASHSYVTSNALKYGKDNKINKAVWVKNDVKHEIFEQPIQGEFIFRAGPVGADNAADQRYYYGEEVVENAPYMSFFDRSKRSPKMNVKVESIVKNAHVLENNNQIQSEESKPVPTIWQYYPLDLLTYLLHHTNKVTNHNKYSSEEKYSEKETKHWTEGIKCNKTVKDKRHSVTNIGNNVNVIGLNRTHNNSNDLMKNNRNIFGNDEVNFHAYEGVEHGDTIKQSSSLIKLLSAITKALKKVMHQFEVVKKVNLNLKTAEEKFNRNIIMINEQIKEFNSKYDRITDFGEKLGKLEVKFNYKNVDIKNKVAELAERINAFEEKLNNVSKDQAMILDAQVTLKKQTEDLNQNQNSIMKSQLELSRRQTNMNFIIKRMKQLLENQNARNKELVKNLEQPITTSTTQIPKTESPKTTEAIKIDLLPMSVVEKIVVNDKDLLRDKDLHDVDDLVYKYYFNNSFMDQIKDTILANVISDDKRSGKIKRDSQFDTTFLYPIDRSEDEDIMFDFNGSERKKRWVNHHSKQKHIRRFRGKFQEKNKVITDDAKIIKNEPPIAVQHSASQISTSTTKLPDNLDTTHQGKKPADPFMAMAKTFCSEITKDGSRQSFMLCIEKTLRRLRNIDMNLVPPSPPSTTSARPVDSLPEGAATSTASSSHTTVAEALVTSSPAEVSTKEHTKSEDVPPSFFPDNDALELNLKEYELKPDTEGNVYYEDSSLNPTEIVQNDEGASDYNESNSRIQIDPIALELQARRRSSVQRFNENFLNNLNKTKINLFG